jgi:putative salt-induced outer membrane protein
MRRFRVLEPALAALAGMLTYTAPVHAADDPPQLGWSGQIALGGSLATGNTDRQALDLETKAQYRSIDHREDHYKALGDLARENGAVTAQRIQMAVQSNYDISTDKFYVLGFTQYDRDKFSGFSYEVEAGPGLGYRFVRTNRMTFFVEFSTGYRHGEAQGAGQDDNQIFARGTITADYKLSDNAKLSNEMLVTGDEQRLKLEDTFSVTSTLIRNIAARISINTRYNSDPPLTVKKVDALSKVSLV